MTLETNTKTKHTIEALGVDIGGVVMDRINDHTDTSFFSDRYLETTATPGVIEALARLVAERFGTSVHLVSKCGPNTERKTREWLAHHDVYKCTGIPEDNLHFCRRRREKAPIAKALVLTHFVDDRLEILGSLKTVPNRFLFKPVEAEVTRYKRHLGMVIRVESWAEIVALLLG
ncbi:MAG TPA: hypothetical protein VM325_03680 [Alphaproteobacteria bacterium]|nr:hypothetical protein [Alphaproteobacteria bacterium]